MAMQRWKVENAATASQAATGLGLLTNAIILDVEHAVGQALTPFGKMVIETVTPLTPRKTGALRNSAKFFVTKEGAKLWQLLVAYGGVAPSFPQIIDDMAPMGVSPEGEVTYAAQVHEVPAKVYSTPGTGMKYLEFGGFVAIPKAYAIFRNFVTNSVSKFRIN